MRPGDVVVCVNAVAPLGLLEEGEIYEVIHSFWGHVRLAGGAFKPDSVLSWMAERFEVVGSVR